MLPNNFFEKYYANLCSKSCTGSNNNLTEDNISVVFSTRHTQLLSYMQNSSADRLSIVQELDEIRRKESAIDDELQRYVLELVAQRSNLPRGPVHETVNLTHSVDKIVEFDPCFEAMIQDSRKLASQIGDCKGLSDRLSSLVRRLDTVQIRAQQALACTEDVINLKSCRHGIEAALEEKNLQAAVSFVKLVHDIDPEVAKSSDDYAPVVQAERETKLLVHEEFKKAVERSDIQMVISLCPTLQTLGLENEARDSFLEFIDKNVFNALSADACAVDGATDPATGYAQALSNIFNAAFAIIQQYLPVVIEGMENSNGDIYFIRKLHAVCTKESGIILKRYMKYRKMKDLMLSIKSGAFSKGVPSVAEVHGILDEFALLLQYCCSYSNYIHDLSRNAEKARNQSGKPGGSKVPNGSQSRIVFDIGHENGFDSMVEELISIYYIESEKWLIQTGLRTVVIAQSSVSSSHGNAPESGGNSQSSTAGDADDGFTSNGGLDEFFFVLQRCTMRAIGSSSVQASCAVLHLIADCLSGDVMRVLNSRLNSSVSKIASILADIISKWSRKDNDVSNLSDSFSSGIKSAFSLASSLTSNSHGASNQGNSAGGLDALLISSRDALDSFNTCSVCVRYIERLSKQVMMTASSVFPEISPTSTSRTSQSDTTSKILICRDDFNNVEMAFKKVKL